MKEIWKDIKGYEGYYQISNLGRLKSVIRIVEHKPYNLTIRERIRKQKIDTKGYYFVILSKNGITKHLKVHQLVANAFISNPLKKKEVNHINGIKTDNRITNLEWVTHKENMQHAVKNNLISKESIKANVERMNKATRKPIYQIKDNKIINKFESISEASRTLGIVTSNINEILKGKRKRAKGYTFKYVE